MPVTADQLYDGLYRLGNEDRVDQIFPSVITQLTVWGIVEKASDPPRLTDYGRKCYPAGLGRLDAFRLQQDQGPRELQDDEPLRDSWETAANETDPKKWASEGHDLSDAVVYSDDILEAVRKSPPGDKLEPISLPLEYYKQVGEQARKRVVAGGVRLGEVLKGLEENH